MYYLISWNQMDILQKHFKKDYVHMHLWTRFYGMDTTSYKLLLQYKMWMHTRVVDYVFRRKSLDIHV